MGVCHVKTIFAYNRYVIQTIKVSKTLAFKYDEAKRVRYYKYSFSKMNGIFHAHKLETVNFNRVAFQNN